MNAISRYAGRLRRAAAAAFGYDAVVDKSHRRSIATVTQSEDAELSPSQRRKLVAQGRDVRRNFEVAAWAVRKHLDFVSNFTFRSTTGHRDWDLACEAFVKEASKRQNFDAAGRYSLRSALRLSEGLRTVEGDLGWLKLQTGKTQLIEGDRIVGSPPEAAVGEWVQGVKLDPAGGALAYSIAKRNGQSLVHERTVAASRLYLHGYFENRYDQCRGISPLTPALNTLRDTYENLDYAKAKAKVVQTFGLALFQQRLDDLDEPDDDEEDVPDNDFRLDPNKGPFTLNLGPHDKAEILQANHPGSDFIDFNDVCIRLALSALDIPLSLYMSEKTNYAGLKADIQLYLQSCEPKRAENRELLDHWCRWRLGVAVARGELDPAAHGLTFGDLSWRWIHRGIPWFDKGREVAGDVLAVHAGFETWGDVIEQRTGETFREVIDRRAIEEAYLREKGVTLAGPQTVLGAAQALVQTGQKEDATNGQD